MDDSALSSLTEINQCGSFDRQFIDENNALNTLRQSQDRVMSYRSLMQFYVLLISLFTEPGSSRYCIELETKGSLSESRDRHISFRELITVTAKKAHSSSAANHYLDDGLYGKAVSCFLLLLFCLCLAVF